MTFVHEDPDFGDLMRIVADKRRLSLGLVEKDYWVTHTLWALHQTGLEIWFKGGTSLSKGFGLIQRFSEDLDLKIEAGSTGLPRVYNWKSEGKAAIAERRAFFTQLTNIISIPGATTTAADSGLADKSHRSAVLRVAYPGRHLDDLANILDPFVVLEVGNARVTPFIERSMSSFIHDELKAQKQISDFLDNRPVRVRCVHPLVTLLEKLDALHRRALNEQVEPAAFVRHYEDAAKIIGAAKTLPPLDGYADTRLLAMAMQSQKQIQILPRSDAAFLSLQNGPRTIAIQNAYMAIAPMFWGPRIALKEACKVIREWVSVAIE